MCDKGRFRQRENEIEKFFKSAEVSEFQRFALIKHINKSWNLIS